MTIDTTVADILKPLEETGVYLNVFATTCPDKPIKNARALIYAHEDYIEIMPENSDQFLQIGRSMPYERTVEIPNKVEKDKQQFTPADAREYNIYRHKQKREGTPLVCTVPTKTMKQYWTRMQREEAFDHVSDMFYHWTSCAKSLCAKLAPFGKFF